MAGNLEKTSKSFDIVIRKNRSIKIETIKKFLTMYCSQYAFIEHKGDIAVDTGLVEGTHYHIVALLPKKKRVYTCINDVTKYFGFDNNHGIEVQPLASLEGAIQYLTHKNDKDKTQHSFDDIISNIDKEELRTIYETENTSLTFDRILFIIKNSKDILDVIDAIGFTRYNMYRNTIRDMIEGYKQRCKSDNLPF